MTAGGVDAAQRAPLEVGWMLCGGAQRRYGAAIETAAGQLRRQLEAAAPGFAWRWSQTRAAPPLPSAVAGEVMELVDAGLAWLDAQRLDFLFVVTDRPLAGSDGRRICAASASTLGISVISLHALEREGHAMAASLEALALHLFGQMAGLAAPVEDGSRLFDTVSAERPAGEGEFSPRERSVLAEALGRVADARIEERGVRGRLSFYLASVAENRREIMRAFVRVRPWLMPLKLSRLTTAAFSTLFVLMVTAEAWELGMAQSPLAAALLSLLALGGTSAYVLSRQRLLVPVHGGRLTEQLAVMRIAVALGVLAGLMSTYLVLFSVSLAAAQLLFPAHLVTGWSGIAAVHRDWTHFVVLSAFVSALGVVIGALGASFENQNYLRHLALIDYELEAPR